MPGTKKLLKRSVVTSAETESEAEAAWRSADGGVSSYSEQSSTLHNSLGGTEFCCTEGSSHEETLDRTQACRSDVLEALLGSAARRTLGHGCQVEGQEELVLCPAVPSSPLASTGVAKHEKTDISS